SSGSPFLGGSFLTSVDGGGCSQVAPPAFNRRVKSLAVRVLGDFGVDGIEPQALGSRKARLALQLIALGAGQAVSAGVLIDALWETVPPARPEAELSRLTGRARLVAAGALLEAGDWMAAADAAAAAAERDPYDEAALRLLLRAHVMGGRVAGALSLYASARERMADELGTDPSPETTALYTAILRGELTAPGPAAPGVAGPGLAGRVRVGPVLVGRDDEVACLE